MASLSVQHVRVDIPVLGVNTRSLRKKLVGFRRSETLIGTEAGSNLVVRALDGIEFSLMSGDRLGLVGANGAGKSTLLRVLAGIYRPTAGTIACKGRVVPLLNIALGMDENSTGRQNIRLRSYFLGLSSGHIAQQEDNIAAFSELGDYLNMPVRTYSTGMRMRLAFAISMAVQAEILLLDEVLGVGDVAFQEKAAHKLREVCECSGIVVMALHSGQAIMDHCNKALWLDKGRIRMLAPSHEVVRAYDDFMHGRKAVA